MPRTSPEAPSSRSSANDGSQVSDPSPAGQSKPAPRAIDLADTPSSHIRNVRLILELAAEHSRNGLKLDDGTLVLDRWAVIDIERKLGAALAQAIADFTPGVVAIDPRDPAQLTVTLDGCRR